MSLFILFTSVISIAFSGVSANNYWKIERMEQKQKYEICSSKIGADNCDDTWKDIKTIGD